MSHDRRIAAGSPISLRCWDGDYVVFNPLSGCTHSLDIVTGEVLKIIITGPSSVENLCDQIATFLNVNNDAHLTSTVNDTLARLEEIGLIELVT